jgi:uncharacterized membrane protein YfcA
METTYIVVLLITGMLVGFASGLLGVGGCFIMIPVQYWVLISSGISPTIAIRVAFGTNLAVVTLTAISGAIGHHKKEAVFWRGALILGTTGLIGAFIGGIIATHIPGNYLKAFFGIAVIISGIRMLFGKPPKEREKPVSGKLPYILWGFPLGIVSGIIGIGGGVLMIPVMVMFLGFSIHQAIGTSTALMILTSIGGSLSYMINGLNVSGLPAHSLGYINLLQWFLLSATSIPMAQIGVKVAHKIHPKILKYIFVIVMFYMAFKMLGVL